MWGFAVQIEDIAGRSLDFPVLPAPGQSLACPLAIEEVGRFDPIGPNEWLVCGISSRLVVTGLELIHVIESLDVAPSRRSLDDGAHLFRRKRLDQEIIYAVLQGIAPKTNSSPFDHEDDLASWIGTPNCPQSIPPAAVRKRPCHYHNAKGAVGFKHSGSLS